MSWRVSQNPQWHCSLRSNDFEIVRGVRVRSARISILSLTSTRTSLYSKTTHFISYSSLTLNITTRIRILNSRFALEHRYILLDSNLNQIGKFGAGRDKTVLSFANEIKAKLPKPKIATPRSTGHRAGRTTSKDKLWRTWCGVRARSVRI